MNIRHIFGGAKGNGFPSKTPEVLRPAQNQAETAPRIMRAREALVRLNGAETRRLEWNGGEWLVVPVVALMEGIIQGSLAEGPEFVSAEELDPRPWNGRPITYYHPGETDGYSANSPATFERIALGYLFNARLEDKKLKGEMWLELAKAERMGEAVLADVLRLEGGAEMDVSTGYWSMQFRQNGEYGGETYEFVTRFIEPDHLAILPGATGACSWADGCGAPRTNQSGAEGGSDVAKVEQSSKVAARLRANKDAAGALRGLRLRGVRLHAKPGHNQDGVQATFRKVDAALAELYGYDYWVTDVYPSVPDGSAGQVVYTVVEYELMQSEYSTGPDGEIVLTPPVEVVAQTSTEYVPVPEAPGEVEDDLPDAEGEAAMNNRPSRPVRKPQAATGKPCGCGAGQNEYQPDVATAIRWLGSAIERHMRHMNGTEATSEFSQQLMMDEMQQAYSALTGQQMGDGQETPQEDGMANMNSKLDKKGLIARILGAKGSRWNEADRPALESMDEALLEKLAPAEPTAPAKPEANVGIPAELSEAQLEAIAARVQAKQERSALVAQITANGEIRAEDLEGASLPVLRTLAAKAAAAVNYGLGSFGIPPQPSGNAAQDEDDPERLGGPEWFDNPQAKN